MPRIIWIFLGFFFNVCRETFFLVLTLYFWNFVAKYWFHQGARIFQKNAIFVISRLLDSLSKFFSNFIDLMKYLPKMYLFTKTNCCDGFIRFSSKSLAVPTLTDSGSHVTIFNRIPKLYYWKEKSEKNESCNDFGIFALCFWMHIKYKWSYLSLSVIPI